MRWRQALTMVAVLATGAVALVVDATPVHAASGVTGFVHDGANVPVADVSLRTSFVAPGLWVATSGPDGTFRFGNTTSFPTGSFTVTAIPPDGSGLGWRAVAVVASDGTNIDITLQPASTVSGTVRGPTGAPLAGATVAFGAPPHAAFTVPYDCPPRAVSAVTAADGTYHLAGLGTVNCPVWFDPPAGSGLASELYVDTANVLQASAVSIATPGTNRTGVDAQFERAGAITGRLTDTAGAPAGDAFVFLAFPNGDPYSLLGPPAITAADGTFTITGLKPGVYDVSHVGGGVGAGSSVRADVPAGGTAALGTIATARLPIVTITDLGVAQMARGSTVHLRITGTNFQPGASVSATVMEAGQATVTDTVVVSSTLVTATLSVIPNPSVPHVSVSVSNPDGSFGNCQQCIAIVDGPGLPQTIAFTTAPPATVAPGSSFPVAAHATTGLDVGLVATGACTGTGDNALVVVVAGPGACTVTANQGGNGAFAPAPTISATTTVTPAAPGAPAAPTIVAASPSRVLDTRPDGPQRGYTGDKPIAGQTIEVTVAGRAGVPADAAAVALNVTGTDATASGFVTVWPCGEERPLASSLNLTPGVTSPNAVVTKLGVGGKVCLYTQSGAHLVADVTGWFPAGASYTAVQPERLLDTRVDGPQRGYVGDKPVGGQTLELAVGGVAGVPADAAAVVLNVTGTDATASGFVTVWPCGEERPLASSLNLTPGVTSPNAVITRLGAGGKVCLYTQNGAHLLADLTGYAT